MTDHLRVLAVDDEPLALADVAELLRDHPDVGEVLTAESSADALKALSTAQIDAVFLDVRMPEFDGIELARVLRRFSRPPALVFVSAYESAVVDAFDLDAADYLMKPMTSRYRPRNLLRASRWLRWWCARARRPTLRLSRIHLCPTQLLINDRVHRAIADRNPAQGRGRSLSHSLAGRHSFDCGFIPGLCSPFHPVSRVSGIAAAHHRAFRAHQRRTDSGFVLWNVHRPGAGLAVASAHRHVWDRENPGGIFRGLRQYAIRRSKPGGHLYPRVLLLFFPSIFLLGSVARAAGRGFGLRCAANCNFWAIECRRSPAVVSSFR